MIMLIFSGMCKEIPTDLSPDERLLRLFDKSLLVSNKAMEHFYLFSFQQIVI
jgi:hypothetical protein